MSLYVDIHVLQTVPPSCVNRDDTGSPKTARYGGVTRARVSSQAWKRAVHLMFEESLEKSQLGVRTKGIVGLVAHEIDPKLSEDARKRANVLLRAADLKNQKRGERNGRTLLHERGTSQGSRAICR